MSDFRGFTAAIESRDLNKVRRLFNRDYINEGKDDGWTALHCASEYDSGEIVRYLVSVGCDVEAKTDKWRQRPIHIAAYNGNIDAMTSLIDAQCTLDCTTNYGQTPLQIATEEKYIKCQKILRGAMSTDLGQVAHWTLSRVDDPKTGTTLLDKFLSKNDPEILTAIKSKPIKEEEINDWLSLKSIQINPDSYRLSQECLIYRCIHQGFTRGFEILCNPEMTNRRGTVFIGSSILEYIVRYRIHSSIKHVLERLENIDETWSIAQDIAKKLRYFDVVDLIESRKSYLGRRKERGYTRLHVAVSDNCPDMVEYLLEKGLVNTEEGDQTIGTALGVAYELDHIGYVYILQKYKVKVDNSDWLRRTPLHLSISNKIEGGQSTYLVDNTNIIEAEDYRGLRAIDRTIINDCKILCEKIIKKNVDLRKYITMSSPRLDCFSDIQKIPHVPLSKEETIYTLCLKYNRTIYPCLLETIDDHTINMADTDGNTPLHLSAVLLEHGLCSQLIHREADMNNLNNNQNTPLLELLEQNKGNIFVDIEDDIVETVTLLIKAGSLVNVENKQGRSVLDVATEYDSQKLLLAIIGNVDCIKYIKPELWSLWMERKYFDTIKAFIPRADKAILHNYIVIDDIKMNIDDASVDLIKDLYNKASQHVQDCVVESILYKAATMNNGALFEEIINKDIYGNSCLVGGESLLNCLIRERKKDFVDIVLGSKNAHLLLEKKNGHKKLPLHVCIESEYWTMLNQISVDTTSVDCEDNDGNTPLALLFKKISATEDKSFIRDLSSFVKNLIARYADVNKENKHGMTAIEYCTNNEVKMDITAFARKHPPPRPVVIQPVMVDPATTTLAPVNNPRPPGAASSQPVCVICDDGPRNCALNCGHIFCMDCAEREIRCYVCRRKISDRRFIYN